MSTNRKWDDASEKDLIFAMLMSTGDGNGTIKADWAKVGKIMASWGYLFTVSAMSQHWSKTIQKAFKERHPDNAKNGGNGNPVTPSKAGDTGLRAPKAPASNKGKGKDRKRPAPEVDGETAPLAKGKTTRPPAKRMKCSEATDVDDKEEHVMVKSETKTDEGCDHTA